MLLELIVAICGIACLLLVIKFGKVLSGNVLDTVETKASQLVGGQERFQAYKNLALEAVTAVQQISTNTHMTNEQKKDLARSLAKDFIEVAELDSISDETLGYIVEAELFLLKLFGTNESKN